ncbi:HesA/MoeB/ThiF family protein [Sphingomonas sp. KR1UV-12]|uniref:HesA/MoeB/ThiF family protein n=1 Tax=Sphingomonas aurea TaxID=3063994 RepID=A0ABT9EIP3_9SPHN|nr:HesA/MoeB/ThiF family protein [Sphingomonas sp. KR1UV-12]MDP1026671.1 HesA/MoeB/ThiF family protein [Sphingomonas sp. KR1UV-12]
MQTFSNTELNRYARHIVLREIGGLGQLRLRRAVVTVVGAGGIGSPALQYLAGAGIGTVRIIDHDLVDLSNLQRQTIYDTSDIGLPKAAAAAIAMARLNPKVATDVRVERVGPKTVDALLTGSDVVIDGTDNFDTRLLTADSAHAKRIPLISAAVGQFEGQLAVFRGWERHLPCYRCLVGNDPDRAAGSCADQGVLGPVTGMMGAMAALEAIRAIVPFGDDPAGRLLLADLLSWRFRSIALPADPGCPTCGDQTPA